MASEFIGLTVLVKLKNPPNTSLQGLVANVIGSTLFLTDVLTSTGHRLPEYSLDGTHIADLEIAPEPLRPSVPQQASHPSPQLRPNDPQSHHDHPHSAVPTPASTVTVNPSTIHSPRSGSRAQPFVDPAILRFGTRPVVTDPLQSEPKSTQETVTHIAKPVVLAVHETVSTSVETVSLVAATGKGKNQDALSSLTTPLDALGLNGDVREGEDTDEPTIRDPNSRKASVASPQPAIRLEGGIEPVDTIRKKRGRATKYKNSQREPLAAITNHDIGSRKVTTSRSAQEHTPNGSRYKGSGWRQTPILQEGGISPQRTPGVIGGKAGRDALASLNRKTKRQLAMEREQARNGWATEDATDVQELGDFDFASNLSKFDKRTVFEQIETEDTTADEDRLVSYNRLPPSKPGTFGGKNLHPSETVLGPTALQRQSGGSSSSEPRPDSGRDSARRTMSRASLRRVPHRKDSQVMDEGVDRMNSSSSITRSMRSQSRTVVSASHDTGSARPGRLSSPAPESASQPNLRFRIASSRENCATLSPAAMTAVEALAESDFGLPEEILAENAARGIAEVTLSAIDPGSRRLARDNRNPVIVVLAGNSKTGARAVAAARHLHARGIRVVVSIIGWDDRLPYSSQTHRVESNLIVQVDRFEKMGGQVKGWASTSAHLKTLDAPPELIIDALLGAYDTYEDLGRGEQEEFVDVVGWANKSKACVLAVDVPSGIDGLTGRSSILEGEPLEIHPKFIVSIAAPITGLLEALAAGEGQGWEIYVVDVGLNAAWRKHAASGSRKPGVGVKFGNGWVVKVEFAEGSG